MADALPVLYLMAPMTLYGTDVLAQARQFPFGTLAGPVTVDCAEGMFPDAAAWAAAWPALRERYSFGVFLDHLGGWVPRGVFAEAPATSRRQASLCGGWTGEFPCAGSGSRRAAPVTGGTATGACTGCPRRRRRRRACDS